MYWYFDIACWRFDTQKYWSSDISHRTRFCPCRVFYADTAQKQSKYRLSKSSRFDSSIIGIVYAELDFRMISITFIIYQQKYGCRRHEASVNMQRLRTSPAMLEFGFPAAFFILRPRCWAKNCLKLCGTFFFCYCSQRGKSPLTHPAVNPHWLFFVFWGWLVAWSTTLHLTQANYFEWAESAFMITKPMAYE